MHPCLGYYTKCASIYTLFIYVYNVLSCFIYMMFCKCYLELNHFCAFKTCHENILYVYCLWSHVDSVAIFFKASNITTCIYI